ncbi:MAG TPA: MFS transporter [Gaiellaceae bacterium]|nr:MFS transporter [Gaiellaceae bacterium]
MSRIAILRPLRERDFALFWLGWTVSLVGDGFFLVAIAWQAFDLWNSPTSLALVGVAETIPTVALVLVGGVVSDRFERRKVLIASSALRGVCVAALGLLAVSGRIQFWHLIAISVAFGAGQAFQGPAAGSIIPDLVPRHLLVQANSLSQFVRQLAFAFIGPAVGGLVVHTAGVGTAFLIDAATFAFAIVTLLFLHPRPAAAESGGEPTSMLRDIAEGLRFVRQNVWLWGTLLWAFVALFLVWGPFQVLLPYVVKNDLGGDPGDLGLIFAFGGLGAVLVSLAIGQLGLPRRHITFMYALWTIACLQIAAYALADLPWQAMVISFFGEACWACGLIVWITLMQRVVPAALLGRVKSVDWLLSIGLVPVSFAVTGPLAAWLGAKPVLVIAGVSSCVLTALIYFLPGMRDTETPGSTSRVILSEPLEDQTPLLDEFEPGAAPARSRPG